jgi:hypothetical protein
MEGTNKSSQTAKTAQRYLRRVLLKRIMNCCMANSHFLPGVAKLSL